MDVLRNHNWVLSVGTFLPLAGVLLMMFVPKKEELTHKVIALVTAILTLGVGIYTAGEYAYGKASGKLQFFADVNWIPVIHSRFTIGNYAFGKASGKLQFFIDTNWIPVIHSRFTVGLDGLSMPLYLLSMVVTLLVMVYSWDHVPAPGNPKMFLILMLVLQTGMAGTFIAQDLILFFVFFELVLLPMYFMIGVWGGEQRQYCLLYTSPSPRDGLLSRMPSSA